MKPSSSHRIAIVGVSGFIGKRLAEALKSDGNVVGLSRNSPQIEGIEWRQADLFSYKQTLEALRDVTIVIYLVHSMIPKDHYTQGHFSDFDLICADNLARSAHVQGVKHILYLGGIIPDENQLSQHLRSRLETELCLRSYGTPVTALRAGLIIGPESSSFRIVENLVKKLPIMITPVWTKQPTQIIALKNVIECFQYALNRWNQLEPIYDIHNNESLCYADILKKTAEAYHKKTLMIPVPFLSQTLSSLWVSYFGKTSLDLVLPLVESLKHEMIASHPNLAEKACPHLLTLESAILEAKPRPQIRNEVSPQKKRQSHNLKSVRSVQRFQKGRFANANAVARFYLEWLHNKKILFLRVERVDHHVYFYLRGSSFVLLKLTYSTDLSFDNRALFYITGGFLSRQPDRDRLEFRDVLGGKFIIAGIHDYKPRLPWFLYRYTQALIHGRVMSSFAQAIEKISNKNKNIE